MFESPCPSALCAFRGCRKLQANVLQAPSLIFLGMKLRHASTEYRTRLQPHLPSCLSTGLDSVHRYSLQHSPNTCAMGTVHVADVAKVPSRHILESNLARPHENTPTGLFQHTAFGCTHGGSNMFSPAALNPSAWGELFCHVPTRHLP